MHMQGRPFGEDIVVYRVFYTQTWSIDIKSECFESVITSFSSV